MLQNIACWTPLNVNKEYLSVFELEKALLAKQLPTIIEIKAKIEKWKDTDSFTKENMKGIKDQLAAAISNIDSTLYDENIADEYLFDILYRDIWKISDDEMMQNKQFRDKMLIFQCYLNPENLGIDQARCNFAVHQLAIKGILIRTDKSG